MSGSKRLLPDDDALLDAQELGELLRVSRSMILRWAAAGDIAFSRIGGRTTFLGVDVRRFVLSRRNERETLGQRVGSVERRCR